MDRRPLRILGTALVLLVIATGPVLAGAHLWGVNETYSNADGTIQFVELWNCCTPGETSIAGGFGVRSLDVPNNTIYVFPSNLPAGSSNNKYLLVATNAFALLPGAPTPDGTIASANSVDITGDVVQWQTYLNSAMTFLAGELPTDGIRSLNRNPATPPNQVPGVELVAPSTPKNFAGDTWKPPGVTGLTVGKILPDGSRLQIGYPTTTCNGHTNHQIVYGVQSQLPDTPGGTFALNGSVCAIGPGSSYNWIGVPSDPAPGGFLWFLAQATNGATLEGAWGKDGNGVERVGPALGGGSGLCGMTAKNLANTCGQ